MEDSPIIIKISYKQISQTSGASKQFHYQNNLLKLNVSVILDQVNQFLVENQIDKFLHVQIKNEGSWKNITEVFSNNQFTQVISQNLNGKVKIEVRLIELKEELEESRKIAQLSEKLQNFMRSETEIEKKIIRDTLRVEDDDIIDLAFFYAEPIYTQNFSFPNYKPVKAREVSFLAETRKIQKKLKESSSVNRSANIEINVATVKNLQIALSKGVKMLHFSCHGVINQTEVLPELVIETQDRTKIGIEERVSIKSLINILSQYKKIPEIIIFNACHSHEIAQAVHNQFDKRGKHIATVGYKGEIQNFVCQQFAQSFYSNIFNGKTIEESFQQSKNIGHEKTRVFYKQAKAVIFKQSKIAEKDKQIYINNKIETQIQYHFQRQFLFKFIHKCINPQKDIINLIGSLKAGKTIFARKSMSYLRQRNQISTFLIIDLREEDYEIANFIQFRCKIENEFRKSGILSDRYQTFIIVIDHCDSVMKYCMKQFISSITELSMKIQPNKLIIITCSTFEYYKYNFTLNPFILSEQYRRGKRSIGSTNTKPKENPKGQQFFDSEKYENNCYLIVLNFFKSLEIQFLSQLSIVSLFPQQIYSSSNSFSLLDSKELKQLLQKTHSDCSLAIYHIKEQIQRIKKKRILLETQQFQSEMMKILKLIYLILGVQFLKFYDLGSSSSSLGDEKRQKPHILRTVHSLINICLEVKNRQGKQFTVRIKQMYEIMQIKLYFFIYFIYLRQEQHNKDMVKIVKEFIWSIEANEQYLFKFQLRNLIKVLHLCKKFYFISKNNTDINIHGNQGININFFKDSKMIEYREKIQEMKNKLAAIHRKMDHRGEHRQQIQSENYECHLYQTTQIEILLLPLLQIIKEEIYKLVKNPVEQNIKQIVEFMEEYKFLENEGILFANIFKNYHSLYLQTLFELEKLKLANQNILKIAYNKFSALQKLNDWIKICRKYNYYWLQKSIEAYKATSFNIFLTMVSFPLNKAYRFQNQIAKKMKQTYLDLDRQIFLNIETLSVKNLKKYKELKVNIPIALYVFDMKRSNDISRVRRRQSGFDEVFACLENYDNERFNEVQHQQQCEYVEYCKKQKLQFLKCGVAILCGHQVRQISNSSISQNCSVRIYIQPLPREQVESSDGEVKKKIKQILEGLILKQIILKFYSVFCQVMYKQNSYKNYYEQVSNSFNAAVLSSRIACLNQYGAYCQEEIKEIFNSISLEINESMKNKPVEKLSLSTDIFKPESKELKISPIERRKKEKEKKMLIYEIEEKTEIAYSSELMFVLKQIVNYYKIKQKKKEKVGALYFVLVCQFQEQTTFLYNLLIKLKKIGNPSIKWMSSRINQRRNSDVSQFNADYSSVEREQKNTVSIIDLTDKNIVDAKNYIQSTMLQQNEHQLDHRFQNLRTMIYICKKQIELKKVQNLHIISMNKFEYKNFIPIIAHKVIQRKCQKRNQSRNSRNWEDVFQKAFDKKMQGKMDIFDQRRQYLTDEEYEKKLKKFKQTMEANLKQLIDQVI